MFLARLEDLRALGFGRLFRRAILHQLDAEHQAFAAHVADDLVLLPSVLRGQPEDELPILSEFACRFSRSMTSSTALPCAQTTGLPPKVLK